MKGLNDRRMKFKILSIIQVFVVLIFAIFGGTPSIVFAASTANNPTVTWFQNFAGANGFASSSNVKTEISKDGANAMDGNSLKMTMMGTSEGDWDNNKNSAIIYPSGQATFDATNYNFLMFYVKDMAGNNNVHVTIKDKSGASWDFATDQNAVKGEWKKIVVTLDKTQKLNWSQISEIRLGEYWNYNNVYYFDDLYFGVNASDNAPNYVKQSSSPIGQSDFLKSQDGFLWNQNNKKVALRGVNLGGWLVQESWMCPVNGEDRKWANLDSINALKSRGFTDKQIQDLYDTYESNWVTTDDLDKLEDMHVNLVRIPFWYRNFMSDENGTWITGSDLDSNPGIQKLDWVIKECSKRGIYVILDCHGVPGGQSMDHSTGTLGQNNIYTSDKDQKIFEDMWTKIANRYKNSPDVAAYDIMNEPQNNNGYTGDHAYTPGSAEALKYTYDIYNKLYKTIRTVDPNHVISMEAIWAGDCLPDPKTYGWTNMLYQMHLYDSTKDNINARVNDLINFQTKYGTAVYAGEFNFGDTNEEYGIEQMNKYGISWTSWAYKGSKQDPGNNWFLYVGQKEVADTTKDSFDEIKRKWGQQIQTSKFYTNSTTVAARIALNTTAPVPNSVFNPTFSPKAAIITSPEDVTISCATKGAIIKYTTDGSDPKSSLTATSGVSPIKVHVNPETTIKAYAVKEGMDASEVITADYTLPKVSNPTFSPIAGGIISSSNVTITSATKGAMIKYTTDGSEPKTSSTAKSAASPLTIQIDPNTKVKAYAFENNMSASETVTAEYPVLLTSKWYQNFESGVGFSAGVKNAAVNSYADTGSIGGSKAVKLVVDSSGDPGEANRCVNILPQSGSKVDAKGYNYLAFYVKDTQGNNTEKITIIDAGGSSWSGWTDQNAVKDRWTKTTLPLSSVKGVDLSAIKEIRIGEWNSGTYYLDDVYFEQTESDASPFTQVASRITSVEAPAKDATQLTLPKVPNGYKIKIKSSDKPNVITEDGKIIPPTVDTTVALVFTVTNVADGTTADTASINVIVPAKTSKDATLKTIAVNAGEVYFQFTPKHTTYTVKLSSETRKAPQVYAVATNSKAKVVITQATKPNGTATIKVTAEDGKTTKTYKIKFKVKRSHILDLDL